MTRAKLGLAAMMCVAGCGSSVSSAPLTSATLGDRVADYPVPSEAPQGDVRLASDGIVDIAPEGQTDEPALRALHLRVAILDDSARDWMLDARDQDIVLPGHGTSAAVASADPGPPPPTVTVPAFSERVVNLFFPLPPPLQHASELPAFDAIWRLHMPDRVITGRTSFPSLGRREAFPSLSRREAFPSLSRREACAPCWYNPFYGDHGFIAIPAKYFSHPIDIHPSRQPGT